MSKALIEESSQQIPRLTYMYARLHSTVVSLSDCRSRGHRFGSQLDYITFLEFGNEVISAVILTLLLIEEGQLSATGICAKILVNYLDD